MEHIAEQVLAVHPDQCRREVQGAHGQRQMLPIIKRAAEDMQIELAIFGRKRLGAHEFDQLVAFDPILDQLGDRNHPQAELLFELPELGHPLHRAIVIHQFAEHSRGRQSGQRGQVDRRLRVTRAFQHATGPGPERKHVPGLHQLFGPGPRIGENPDRLRAILGADARRDPFRGVDADGEIRAMRLPVLAHHRAEGEAFELGFKAGHANDATAVADHHADGLGGDLGSRHDQIAFIFPIRVVRHDHQPAGGNLLNGGLDRIERWI